MGREELLPLTRPLPPGERGSGQAQPPSLDGATADKMARQGSLGKGKAAEMGFAPLNPSYSPAGKSGGSGSSPVLG